jgi:hypothetical protein
MLLTPDRARGLLHTGIYIININGVAHRIPVLAERGWTHSGPPVVRALPTYMLDSLLLLCGQGDIMMGTLSGQRQPLGTHLCVHLKRAWTSERAGGQTHLYAPAVASALPRCLLCSSCRRAVRAAAVPGAAVGGRAALGEHARQWFAAVESVVCICGSFRFRLANLMIATKTVLSNIYY